MRPIVALAALIALLPAAPASARDARLTVAGVSYALPAPDGYCDTGPGVDRYIAQASEPPALILVRCGKDSAFDYYFVDVAKDSPPLNRDAFLAEMIRTMPGKPAGIEAQTADGIARRLDDALRNGAGADGFVPIGVDDVCAYAYATRDIFGAAKGSKADMIAVACATVIDKHIVYFMRYLPSGDAVRAKAALGELRAMVVAVAPAPTT